MKNLFMALLAFFGFGHAATAQEPPKTKQKPRTTDTTKTRKATKGGVKRIDTTSVKPADKKKSKTKAAKDTVTVQHKK